MEEWKRARNLYGRKWDRKQVLKAYIAGKQRVYEGLLGASRIREEHGLSMELVLQMSANVEERD